MTTKRFCDKCGKEITGEYTRVEIHPAQIKGLLSFSDFYDYHESCWGDLKKILLCGEVPKNERS